MDPAYLTELLRANPHYDYQTRLALCRLYDAEWKLRGFQRSP